MLQLKETVDVAEVDQIIELARLRTTAIFATDKPLTLARDLQRGFLAQGRHIHVGETKRKRQQIALIMGVAMWLASSIDVASQ